MNNVVCHRRHSEITNDANDHKNEVSRISCRKEGIACLINLLNIQGNHFLLNFTNDGTKDVSHRKPKKNIDIARYPYNERVRKTIKHRNTKYQRTQDRQYDQVERTDSI